MAKALIGRITVTFVNALEQGQTLRDTDIKGFGVRRQQGAPSYFLQTRIKGRLRWMTIGPHGSPWTPATARKEAIRLLSEIAHGLDPSEALRFSRISANVKDLSSLFLEEHGPKLKASTRSDYKRLLDQNIVPAFGKRKIEDLTRSDIIQFHNKLGETPRKANYCLAVLSKFLSWAETEGLRPENSNPCRLVKPYTETKRQRYLSKGEFERLGSVLSEAERDGSESAYVIAAIRLLLMTGARLSEILTLKWQYADLERGFLLLPDSKTGQKPIFLNEPTKDLIRAIPRVADNPYVIVGARTNSHLINLQKPWRRIRKLAQIEDIRLHDLRHSFASIAAESGASLPLIGRLLGHSQVKTTQRYAHLSADPIRSLNETIGTVMAHALQPPKND